MNKEGFTLIELLVVIAIIALLLSILMPSLRKAKEQAQLMVCRSNLKQYQLGMRLYWDDNGDKLFAYRSEWFFINFVAPYVDDVDAIRYCPSAAPKPGRSYGLGTAKEPWGWTYQMDEICSYGFNNWMYEYNVGLSHWMPPNPESLVFSSPSTIRQPASVPTAGDCSWQGAYTYWEDIVRPGFDVSLGDGWHYQDNQLTRFAIDRHNMKIGVSFVDGHAEAVKLSDLWTKDWHENWKRTFDVQFP